MSRKIIVHVAMSADGFIARPDGSVDWLDRPRPKGNYGMNEFYRSIDTIVMGRKTYDFALEFEKQGKAASVFDPGKKHYIFSRTIAPSDRVGLEFVHEPVKEFAARLRSEPGKDVWNMGGAEIIGAFLDAGEVDEFSIAIIPIFIGEGIPLIAPRRRTMPLELLSAKSFPDGVVVANYRCVR
jgi:dihydrofolate reductase